MMISVSDREENILGKERKCWLPAFSPFPTTFSKDIFLRAVKTSNRLEMGKAEKYAEVKVLDSGNAQNRITLTLANTEV